MRRKWGSQRNQMSERTQGVVGLWGSKRSSSGTKFAGMQRVLLGGAMGNKKASQRRQMCVYAEGGRGRTMGIRRASQWNQISIYAKQGPFYSQVLIYANRAIVSGAMGINTTPTAESNLRIYGGWSWAHYGDQKDWRTHIGLL